MKTHLVPRHASLLGLSVACLPFSSLVRSAQAPRIRDVTVIGLDYAYQAPDTIPGGITSISFENYGKVFHEMIIFRLRAGVSMDSLLHAAPPARITLAEVVGILIAGPGEKALGRILADLSPGRTYVLFCNFQDATDKPRHSAMGMLKRVEVR